MNEFKEKVLKAQSEGDIASLYVLEVEAQELLEESDLIAYYANILDLALENLTSALENARQMDIAEVQDFATLRALYEYAMEHYSAGKKTDASALFEILAGLCSDATFSESMKIHQLGADAGLTLDLFIATIADVDATHRAHNFYISHFKKEALAAIQRAGTKS
ncbi:MAG: hypothetical protein PF439_10025 [Helicobacteraceae bacterium]|jgi:hypothetical protein|nr:hypothetical protein [Helicobacteraceae bacterium]